MFHGRCRCGAIRYEIGGSLDRLMHCHCSQCRKAPWFEITDGMSAFDLSRNIDQLHDAHPGNVSTTKSR